MSYTIKTQKARAKHEPLNRVASKGDRYCSPSS